MVRLWFLLITNYNGAVLVIRVYLTKNPNQTDMHIYTHTNNQFQ